MDFDLILEQLKKFVKNPNVIGISSNFINNINTCICISENVIKMEKSHLVIFDEIWPMTMYCSTGCSARFLNNFKNLKKEFNFDQKLRM